MRWDDAGRAENVGNCGCDLGGRAGTEAGGPFTEAIGVCTWGDGPVSSGDYDIY